MMDKVKDNLELTMNFTNAQDHVPEAERNNRTIKERIRASYPRLPYMAIPRIMIRTMAMNQANQLNLFPAKGGVSPYYSPRMLLDQTSLDYNKHCTVPFRAYVQANHKSTRTSSNTTRMFDAIYLRLAQNQQGGHELMDLNSGKLITRNIVHEIPVTDVVIKAVEAMTYTQGFTTLKFKNRNKIIFHDADWIAGVDYDDNEEDNDDESYTEEDDNDENEEDERVLDPIDQDEIDDIISDAHGHTNPTTTEETEPDELEQGTEQNTDEPQQVESTRRSTRHTSPIERLEPTMTGKSYTQTKQVTFENDKAKNDEYTRLEYCHNLIVQTKPDEFNSENTNQTTP
jgi:hypothetical protein